jgi:hypothetical protein
MAFSRGLKSLRREFRFVLIGLLDDRRLIDDDYRSSLFAYYLSLHVWPKLANYRSRELSICTKICTKIARLMLRQFLAGSWSVS